MTAKNTLIIAVLFLCFGIAGRMSFEDELRCEAEDKLQRENIALRVQIACAKSLSCDGLPESFMASVSAK